ncbi:rhodanese-like/PpiC domain-containing protein 12, chloroplastic [Mangifera indica]|uniref:rhodanese-like/PpiC domain-containing protein 12, chloroplastic n=1 Tax=Mangifera indica TaxID=29780 RepID=UPI001CFAF59E|nr:rhodanese-like/PpiC domain-containing protein 12, chloroplastic [Mangifera indica]
MIRTTHISPVASPVLFVLKQSLFPSLNLSSSFLNYHQLSTLSSFRTLLPKPLKPSSLRSVKRPQPMIGRFPCAKASFSGGSSGSEGGKEILVQHLLVKEDDLKLLLDLQRRIAEGEDLSDLAVEYSVCPSKQEGGMLGWVRKGQMVPEFEEVAFSSPLNKVARVKTQFGWHLLQVLSEREESSLQDIQPDEFHVKMQDPDFLEEARLIDVREPDEVARASLPGFKVLPLRQFGTWGPDITTKFDPQKDTYVMCHHGMRSLQVAKWLQTQGFRRVFNLSGGIHAYATQADPSIPTY